MAQLKLNADWVVLSACNTIAGEKPGAEALSGLARAFFYAGARAMLVSHWEVASDAATRLTTSAFAILKADPSLGRAEAMRRAMLSLPRRSSVVRERLSGGVGTVRGDRRRQQAMTRSPRHRRPIPVIAGL